MIKVLICEDEKRICKLIQNIISWEVLGFEIIDFANSGTEAIEKIKLYNPQVVITDIRMPGCSGLEMIREVNNKNIKFIIISGYKQFEYAKSAIKYGVEDYILKPIDKDELTNTLIRVKEELELLKISTYKDTELKNSKEKIRENFINNIILKGNLNQTIDKINSEFSLSFQQGVFRAYYIRLFNTNNEQDKFKNIFNLIKYDFIRMFMEVSFDIISNIYKEGLLLVVNYSYYNEKQIIERFNSYLNSVKKISDKFYGIDFIIGGGVKVKDVNEIHLTIDTSIKAIAYRLNYGLNTFIDFTKDETITITQGNLLTDKKKWHLKNILESYNKKEFSNFINEIFFKDSEISSMNAIDFISLLEYINTLILEVYKSIDVVESKSKDLIEKYNELINFEVDKEIILNKYKMFIIKQLDELYCGIDKKEIGVILRAKKYILDNYIYPITLEEVSEAVELSPAYLSTMFKKELGINFSEYIMELRVEMAKNILKTTNYSIAETAEKVGYSDCRYFSKLFNKIVGIKPSKYKKLYNNG